MPVRVLYINGNIMKRGGIEAFMMNYFRHIDQRKVHIDFLVHGYEKGVYDDEILAAGSHIYHVPTKSKHPIRYQKEVKKLLVEQKFDIIHSHLDAMSGWILKIAKQCGVPVRIAHSHNTDHLTTSKLKRMINDYYKRQIPKHATDLFACSNAAGKWLFGENRFLLIPNAVEVDKYLFNKGAREAYRTQYGWEDEFVIGHVGRFDYQKNQEFIIDILPEVIKKRNNVRVVFVGDGNNLNGIKDRAVSLGVQDRCSFMGSREDVAELYSAFDLFVLPSRFEGLGIVAVEAQINGLPCILSDAVPEEARICKKTYMLSLTDRVSWIDHITNDDQTRNDAAYTKAMAAKYDISIEAKTLEEYYVSRVNEI